MHQTPVSLGNAHLALDAVQPWAIRRSEPIASTSRMPMDTSATTLETLVRLSDEVTARSSRRDKIGLIADLLGLLDAGRAAARGGRGTRDGGGRAGGRAGSRTGSARSDIERRSGPGHTHGLRNQCDGTLMIDAPARERFAALAEVAKDQADADARSGGPGGGMGQRSAQPLADFRRQIAYFGLR